MTTEIRTPRLPTSCIGPLSRREVVCVTIADTLGSVGEWYDGFSPAHPRRRAFWQAVRGRRV